MNAVTGNLDSRVCMYRVLRTVHRYQEYESTLLTSFLFSGWIDLTTQLTRASHSLRVSWLQHRPTSSSEKVGHELKKPLQTSPHNITAFRKRDSTPGSAVRFDSCHNTLTYSSQLSIYLQSQTLQYGRTNYRQDEAACLFPCYKMSCLLSQGDILSPTTSILKE